MLFDESKRKELISAYRSLPEGEQIIYRALAVVFVPVPTIYLTEIMNAVKNSLGFPHKWKAQTIHQYVLILKRWERAELAERCMELHSEGWACARLLTEVAARDAIDRGEYERFDEAAEKVLRLSIRERSNAYNTVTEYLRAVRKVFYRGDVPGYERLSAAEIYAGTSRYGQLSELHSILQIVGNPVESDRLSSLPPRLGSVAFLATLRTSFDDPDTFRNLFAAFDAYCTKHRATRPSLVAEWSEFALLAGRMEEVLRVLGETNLLESYSVRAMDALLHGNRDRALILYEEGIKLMRSAKGRRKVGYYSWTGIFYPILLLAANAPVKKIEDYLEGARTLFSGHTSPASFDLLHYL
ncbi:MAG: hypothetical protein LBS00_13235, partial [Synergistaceae bacterium]|nr:hypothetical protein [Synergistaceae bacterium]